MRQRFFTTTAQSKMIQNLLYNVNFPIFNTIRAGDYIIKGVTYIYDFSIIICTKSGYFSIDPTLENINDAGNIATFDIITDKYYFGNQYRKFTHKIHLANSFYDSKTHEWLGEYLRCVRDLRGIDLMPFYNCFSGIYTTKFLLTDAEYTNTYNGVTETGTMKIVSTYSYDEYKSSDVESFHSRVKINYKTLQIPIKFNRKYTIAIDCDSEVSMAPAFISYGQLLDIDIGGTTRTLTKALIANNGDGYYKPLSKTYSRLSFTSPIVFEVPNNTNNTATITNSSNLVSEDANMSRAKLFQRYEKYLTLLIQLPKDNNSSIVVLEGDYTDLSNNQIFPLDKVISNEAFDEVPDSVLDDFCLSKLSLLQMNDGKNYPFADRLIEFLLWNAITSNDTLSDNIKRVQQQIVLANHPGMINGAWDNFLRFAIYRKYMRSNRTTHLDNTGYVDKNVEQYLERGAY